MTVRRRLLRRNWLAALCLALAAGAAYAQKQPAAKPGDDVRKVLAQKAVALEERGHPDLALQVWRQILLADPANAEALAGAARDSKSASAASPKEQNAELKRAGELARAGKNEEAMAVYRKLYGERPPEGAIALAYYQTLYGTREGKPAALAALRALMQRNPGDPAYAVALGRLLTYDAKSRTEGVRILKQHPQDAQAQAALRQALLWDSDNPASAAEMRGYVKEHPQDAELSALLQANERKLAERSAGAKRAPEEQAAFAALNAHRSQEAAERFSKLIGEEPRNGRLAAGMGYVRMQQSEFDEAVRAFTRAEELGYKDKSVEKALAEARFWAAMGKGAQALEEDDLNTAAQSYRAALAMRPHSPEAQMGLAGVYVKSERFPAGAQIYEQLTREHPSSVEAWRGLFLAYARMGENPRALELTSRWPEAVRTALRRDPEFLRSLADVYRALGRTDEAERTLAEALALPFSENGSTTRQSVRLEYAAVLMEARRYEQALGVYAQAAAEDPLGVPAWMGLILARHQLGQDNEAIEEVKKMPAAAYESAVVDPGFLALLGSLYAGANQLEIAQELLERAVALQGQKGGKPALDLQLLLAAVELKRNQSEKAFAIYRALLGEHPDSSEAWKGLIGALLASKRTGEAVVELEAIPSAVRKRLGIDVEFVQTEASVYAAAGDNGRAVLLMGRALAYYAAKKIPPPPAVDVQNAWLLFNTRNDRALYPALMRLGGRRDLSTAQREEVQSIWADWSVRRAGAAIENGNLARAIEILDAAAQAFPDNMTVRKAVAGGYVQAGRAKEAVQLYKSIPMQEAAASDFQGAVGAALAAGDRTQAELWLRQALERYPRDPGVLQAAARYEEARGDHRRAAEYWRASLEALPKSSAVDRLAHTLAYPDEDTRPHKAVTAADLERLLDPENEPFPKTNKLPPLPAYGPDPYETGAPVVVPPSGHETAGPHAANEFRPRFEQAALLRPLQRPQAVLMSDMPEAAAPLAAVAHSPRIDSERGLIAALLADKRIDEALAELNKLPAELRALLETEIEFVRTEAALYAAAGDLDRAATCIARVNRHEQARRAKSDAAAQSASDYAGRIQLPAAEENVATTERQETAPEAAKLYRPQTLSPEAARAQALFAEQTDSQLILNAGNILRAQPLSQPDAPAAASAIPMAPATAPPLNATQYTPSAQDAASGAFSAPRKPSPQPSSSAAAAAAAMKAPSVRPQAAQRAVNRLPVATKSKGEAARSGKPTAPDEAKKSAVALNSNLSAQPPSAAIPQTQPAQEPAANALEAQSVPSAATGITDQELRERNLPPLRGPWVRLQREPHAPGPRETAEQALGLIESGYSGWLGGSGAVSYRGGSLGFERLADLEAPFEASTPLGAVARFTVIARPVFLDAGQADGTARMTLTNLGQNGLATLPKPLGSQMDTSSSVPAQQNAAGLGGEMQLAWENFAIAGGYTPFEFLKPNFIGRLSWRPANGAFAFNAARDPVKDSQLSYAGLRDPGAAFTGKIWGGVVSNQAGFQFAHGDELLGFYFGANGAYLTGRNVESNRRIDGDGGAYWRVYSSPEYGALTVGANFFAMHYSRNLNAFSWGMGGYFSPQIFFLGNAPVSWRGHYGTRLHYNLNGGLGVQAFETDLAPLFPIASSGLESAQTITIGGASYASPALPPSTAIGANFDVCGEMAYQIDPHWYAGGFFAANNSRNYNAASAGFFVRYLFRAQPATAERPTGLFPIEGLRPFAAP